MVLLKVLGETENWRVLIDFPYPNEIFLALHFDRFSLEGWAVSGFVKKLGIGSPSQSSFRFFIWGPVKCWARQRTGKFG